MRILFLLLLLGLAQVSLQAQIIDSLPWFKRDFLVLQLEELVGPMTMGQKTSLDEQLDNLRTQSTSSGKSKELRQQLRKAIVGVLSQEQKFQLKALKDSNGKDPIGRMLANMRRKE